MKSVLCRGLNNEAAVFLEDKRTESEPVLLFIYIAL